MIRVDINETFTISAQLIDEETESLATGRTVNYDIRYSATDAALSPPVNGTLTESTVEPGLYRATEGVPTAGQYIIYTTSSGFLSNLEELIVNEDGAALQSDVSTILTTVSGIEARFEDGAVWCSQSMGRANGTGHANDPVDDLDVAVGIAIENNLRRIRLVGWGYYLLGVAMIDFVVISDSNLGYNGIDMGAGAGFDVTGTHFKGCMIWKNNAGDFTWSQYSAEDCNLFAPMDDITGVFTRCFLLGVISNTRYQIVDGLPSVFIDCCAGTPGEPPTTYYQTPRFDLTSRQSPTPWAQEVVFQRYSGNITLEGMDHADSYCDVNMMGGVVTLESDNTLGTYRISGICQLIDNSGSGCTVIDNRGAEQSDVSTILTTVSGIYKSVGYDDGAVWVDATLGDDANSGRVGDPVQTLPRAKAVAAEVKTTRMHIKGWHILTENFQGYDVYGGDQFNTGIQFDGYDVGTCTFYDMILWGDPATGISAGYVAFRCYLYSTAGGWGTINIAYDECAFGGRSSDEYPVQENVSVTINRCYSAGTGNLDPHTGTSFDLSRGTASTPMDVSFTKWSGNLILKGLTDGNVWVNGSGRLNVYGDCTGGTVVIRGAYEVIDNSGPGCNVINQSTALETTVLTTASGIEASVENTHDLTKQNRYYNIAPEDVVRSNTVPTASQTIRNVPLGYTDYVIVKIKGDSDGDWDTTTTSGITYAWYTSITAEAPYKMGDNGL